MRHHHQLPYPTLFYKVPYPSAFAQGREGWINSEVLARNKGESGKVWFFLSSVCRKVMTLVHHDNVAKEKKKPCVK